MTRGASSHLPRSSSAKEAVLFLQRLLFGDVCGFLPLTGAPSPSSCPLLFLFFFFFFDFIEMPLFPFLDPPLCVKGIQPSKGASASRAVLTSPPSVFSPLVTD